MMGMTPASAQMADGFAGPDLLGGEVGSASGWRKERGAVMSKRADGLAVSFPRADRFIGPDHRFMLGETSPAVERSYEPPLDLSPWDVIAFEATGQGDDVSTFALRLMNPNKRTMFVFPTESPGERSRQFLDLRWHAGFDPAQVQRLMLHKLYAYGHDRFTVHRMRPAHRAVVRLWSLQDALARAGEQPAAADASARSSLSSLGDQAAALEARYWEGELTGAALDEAVAGLAGELSSLQVERVHVLARRHAEQSGAEGFVTVTESSMRRLPLGLDGLTPTFGETLSLSAAGRERASAQVALVPLEGPLGEVTWSMSDLRQAGTEGASVPATARLVGYVRTVEDTRYQPTHANPAWRADPLLDFVDTVPTVPRDELLALWVTVEVPGDAPAGRYEGELTLRVAGLPPRVLPVTLEVWPFSLPQRPALRTAFHLPSPFLDRVYAGRSAEALRAAEDLMLKTYRLDPGRLYHDGPPGWDASRLRELADAGLPGINLGHLKGSLEQIQPVLAQAERYLKDVVEPAGLRELCYFYGFDEASAWRAEDINAIAKHLAERFPGIPLMTTLRSTRFGGELPDGGAIDIYVPRVDNLMANEDQAAAARRDGRQVWYYTCVGPDHPYPNLFVDFPLIDSRLLLGALAARYEVGGFLYYAAARWEHNDAPITSGPRTDWNINSYHGTNGDGSLLYAGPQGPIGSMRLENLRDGMEDLAYYQLLRERLEARGESASAGEVDPAVLTSAVRFTRDPAVLEAERRRVAQRIVELSDAPNTDAQ